MSSYITGSATIATTAVKVCTVGLDNDGVMIQNTGTAAVFIGGPNVTATGATIGLSVAGGAAVTLPTVGGQPHDVWAICAASSTSTVTFLYPA